MRHSISVFFIYPDGSADLHNKRAVSELTTKHKPCHLLSLRFNSNRIMKCLGNLNVWLLYLPLFSFIFFFFCPRMHTSKRIMLTSLCLNVTLISIAKFIRYVNENAYYSDTLNFTEAETPLIDSQS